MYYEMVFVKLGEYMIVIMNINKCCELVDLKYNECCVECEEVVCLF